MCYVIKQWLYMCHGAARGIQERGDEEYNKQGI